MSGEAAPYNARFPNQNQTKHCWINYVDYYRCVKHYEGENPKFDKFKNAFQDLCPNAWMSEWDNQREAGTFPAPI